LVSTVDGSIKTNFGTAITINNDYVIVDCVKGICKKTEGYLKNASTMYAFHGTKNGVAATADEYVKDSFTKTNTINEADKCTEKSYIGRLYNTDAGVCLGDKIGLAFDGSNENRYIINGAAESAKDTPFEGTVVALKVGADYIIKDLFYNSKLHIK